MNPTYHNVHNNFKLNGFHLNREDLCRVAYSFIKEGAEHEKPVGDFILDWFDNRSYIIMSTSGTTGTPKDIKVDKQAMVNSALATGNFFDIQTASKALHCLPTKYIAGKMMLIRGFILGLDLDFVAPSSRPLLNNKTKYDFVAMVPLQAQNSLKDLDGVKKLIVGGAQINKKLENKLQKLKTVVYETYGMTETITHIAAKKVGEKAFTVLPNVSIAIDANNCLIIQAPNVSKQTIKTNDLVELTNDKQFVFLGRFDNVVNSGGIKLLPELIEAKLSPAMNARFFVIGKPDESLGEKLILLIEGDELALSDTLFDVLDKFEKPKEVHFIPKFKETESGKIKRKETLFTVF